MEQITVFQEQSFLLYGILGLLFIITICLLFPNNHDRVGILGVLGVVGLIIGYGVLVQKSNEGSDIAIKAKIDFENSSDGELERTTKLYKELLK